MDEYAGVAGERVRVREKPRKRREREAGVGRQAGWHRGSDVRIMSPEARVSLQPRYLNQTL